MSQVPGFLIIECDASASAALTGYVDIIRQFLLDKEGRIILAETADRAEALEDGTALHAVSVFKFENVNKAKGFWLSEQNINAIDDAFGAGGLISAIVTAGIPEEGLPEEAIPTVANVNVPESSARPAYMLVQGTISDPTPIGDYMATIIPMIKERGGVYRIWTPPDGPEVLAGTWEPQYIVFSEWPSIAEPRDFWYSDTYQNKAIPTRKPASDFRVLLFEATL